MSQNTPSQPQDPRYGAYGPQPGPTYQHGDNGFGSGDGWHPDPNGNGYYQVPPQQPYQGAQFQGPQQPPVPPKKNHTKCKIAGGVLGAFVLIGAIVQVANGGGDQPSATAPVTTQSSAPAPSHPATTKPADKPVSAPPADPKQSFHPHSLADVESAVSSAGVVCSGDWEPISDGGSGMEMAGCTTTLFEVVGVVYSTDYGNLGKVFSTLGPDYGMAGYYYTSGKTWVIVSDTKSPIDEIHDTVTGGHHGQY